MIGFNVSNHLRNKSFIRVHDQQHEVMLKRCARSGGCVESAAPALELAMVTDLESHDRPTTRAGRSRAIPTP